MIFDKMFIPSHVSVNHIKMCSWTAKAYHGLFIVSTKLRTDCKKDDRIHLKPPPCKWTVV